MLKLAEKDLNSKENNIENTVVRREVEKCEARKKYLEITLEQEKNNLLQLKNKMEKNKEEMIISIILIGLSIVLLVYLGTHAMSVVLNLISRPVLAIIVLGGIIKFISYTVEYAKEHIPMYIWCKQETNGKEPCHDNYVRQYNGIINMCKEIEKELSDLNDIILNS